MCVLSGAKLINLTQLLPSYMGGSQSSELPTDLADKSYKWSSNMNESYRNQDHRMCWRPATLRDLPRFTPLVVVAPASSPSLVASAAPCCLLLCLVVWAFVSGCNSFPYLVHCGDLVCGDRQQSSSTSAVHSYAAECWPRFLLLSSSCSLQPASPRCTQLL